MSSTMQDSRVRGMNVENEVEKEEDNKVSELTIEREKNESILLT